MAMAISSVACHHSAPNLSLPFKSCSVGTLLSFHLQLLKEAWSEQTWLQWRWLCLGVLRVVRGFLAVSSKPSYSLFSVTRDLPMMWQFCFRSHIDNGCSLVSNSIFSGNYPFCQSPNRCAEVSGLVQFISLFLGSIQLSKQASLTPLLLYNMQNAAQLNILS